MSVPTQDQPYVVSICDGILVAAVAGHSDERCILATLDALADVITSSDETRWVVDMSAVDYLSSAGLGRLVALHKKAESGSFEVRFAAIRPEIVEVLEVMRLDDVIALFPTVAEACSTVSA